VSDSGRLALKTQIIRELEEENSMLRRKLRELAKKYDLKESDLSLTEISRIS
jgi:hypothetical protein